MDITDLIGAPPRGVFTQATLLPLAVRVRPRGRGGRLLAACGSSSSSSSTGSTTASATVAHVGGPVKLFTWQGYDLTKTFAPWRKEHNITETVKYLSNQFDVAALLKGPNGKQYDSSSANQAYTQLFQSFGIMAPITTADVPSMANLFSFFRESPIWRWSGTSTTQWNSVPWTWGPLGINYLTDRVPKPDSYDCLDRPQEQGSCRHVRRWLQQRLGRRHRARSGPDAHHACAARTDRSRIGCSS